MDKKTKKLVTASIIGAVYAALTVALGFMAYGMIQFRVAEALCILPFFFPESAWGLFVGCIIANLIGGNGPADIVFGSLATLLAGLCTAQIGKRSLTRLDKGGDVGWGSCVAACAMPVIFNIPIVGAVLTYTLGGESFWTFGMWVGIGEIVVMFVLGLPLMRVILGNEKLLGVFRM